MVENFQAQYIKTVFSFILITLLLLISDAFATTPARDDRCHFRDIQFQRNSLELTEDGEKSLLHILVTRIF